MLSFAENQLEEIREQWETAKARAVARGIHPIAVALASVATCTRPQ